MRSPELASLDASIAAAERNLKASNRAFWVPTLTLNAGVDYLASKNQDSGFNQTEWIVKGLLSYPIARGGARFAGLDQARASLDSLRTDRRATVNNSPNRRSPPPKKGEPRASSGEAGGGARCVGRSTF